MTEPWPYKRIPWLTYGAIGFIEAHIEKDWSVFEWGSGGSTLYFLDKGVKWLTTIEHDWSWMIKLPIIGAVCISLKHIPPEPAGLGINPCYPEDYYSSDIEFKSHKFEKYAKAIDDFKDESLQLVLVDGRARPSCVKHAIPKVAKGGYLVLDNSERLHYFIAQGLLKEPDWKIYRFAGHGPYSDTEWETTIYQKR